VTVWIWENISRHTFYFSEKEKAGAVMFKITVEELDRWYGTQAKHLMLQEQLKLILAKTFRQ